MSEYVPRLGVFRVGIHRRVVEMELTKVPSVSSLHDKVVSYSSVTVVIT
jgi:hypothetical protein